MRNGLKVAAGAVALGAMAAGAMAGITYDVDPNEDIQAVIDATSPGDTIRFAAGTYNQALYISHTLKLQGVGGSAKAILDGSGLGGPIIQFGTEAATAVTIQNLVFRFVDSEYGEYGYPAIDAYDGATGLQVLSSTFRALDGPGVDASGDVLFIKGNVFRGCNGSYDLNGSDITALDNSHRSSLEWGGYVESDGGCTLVKERVAGCNGVGLEVESQYYEAAPYGSDVMDNVSVRRSVSGAQIDSSQGSSVVNSNFTNVSGRAVGFSGYDFRAESNKFAKCAISVQVDGEDCYIQDNRIRTGNIGILVFGEATVANNYEISDVIVGVRVSGATEGFPTANNEGGYTEVLNNKVKGTVGLGIVVNDVDSGPEVSDNRVEAASGRTYVDIVFNLTGGIGIPQAGPVEYDGRFGAITLNRTIYATVDGNLVGDVDAGHGIGVYQSHQASITQNRVGAFDKFFVNASTKVGERENGGVDLNGIDVAHFTPDAPFFGDEAGPDSYFYYFLSQGGIPFPAVGVNPDYYYSSGRGYSNEVRNNTISAAATAGGAGINVRSQNGPSISDNTVCYSGGTGILLDSVDGSYTSGNHVKDSERDGIWLVRGAYYDGGGLGARSVGSTYNYYDPRNRIYYNLVERSGAEGIQNNAEADYDYDYYQPGYCGYYDGSGNCVEGYYYGPYPGSYGFTGATIIRGNTVRYSGIANFANEGDVDVDNSTGNVSVDDAGIHYNDWDWYDIPVRQY